MRGRGAHLIVSTEAWIEETRGGARGEIDRALRERRVGLLTASAAGTHELTLAHLHLLAESATVNADGLEEDPCPCE